MFFCSAILAQCIRQKQYVYLSNNFPTKNGLATATSSPNDLCIYSKAYTHRLAGLNFIEAEKSMHVYFQKKLVPAAEQVVSSLSSS